MCVCMEESKLILNLITRRMEKQQWKMKEQEQGAHNMWNTFSNIQASLEVEKLHPNPNSISLISSESVPCVCVW